VIDHWRSGTIVTHRRGISERDAARDLDSSTCRSTVLSSYNLAIESNAPELLSRPLKRIRSAERSRKDSLDVPADLYTHVRTLCSLSLSLSLSLRLYLRPRRTAAVAAGPAGNSGPGMGPRRNGDRGVAWSCVAAARHATPCRAAALRVPRRSRARRYACTCACLCRCACVYRDTWRAASPR